MRFFTAPHTIKLPFRVIGSGEQAVLLLHDWGTTGHSWDELLSRWRPEDLTIYVPDLRGCGNGPHPASSYTMEIMVDDLVRFCDEYDLDRILVVGQGMGGALGQLLAAREPDRIRRLVLINPAPATGVPMSPEVLALHEGAADDLEARKWLVLMGLGGNRTQALVKRLQRLTDHVDPMAMDKTFAEWQKAWFPELLAKISCPVLVIGGTNDPLLKPYVLLDEVVTPLRQAQVQWLSSWGHNLSNEQPGPVAAAIERFRRGGIAGRHDRQLAAARSQANTHPVAG